MKRIELHAHSSYSDGTCPPADLAKRAKESGVDFAWLTDHDTMDGAAEFNEAAAKLGVRSSCGIEINTRETDQVHILGYGVNQAAPGLSAALERWRERRVVRAKEIVERLQSLGVAVEWKDVESQSRQTVGRPHVADALKRRGAVKSRQEAFDRFLSRGKPGYVEPMGPSVEEAIGLVRECGGFAVLAHPKTVSDCKERIGDWIRLGLEGIEVFYAAHRAHDIRNFSDMAASLGLLAAGGSDFHGPGTGRDGSLGVAVPDGVFVKFEERLSRC
ncbi:MAG: PHP domain-containing protein [Elusimicrobiota bacterium]